MKSICSGRGARPETGLCQFILAEDGMVAVLIWCAAAWHLQALRDAPFLT